MFNFITNFHHSKEDVNPEKIIDNVYGLIQVTESEYLKRRRAELIEADKNGPRRMLINNTEREIDWYNPVVLKP